MEDGIRRIVKEVLKVEITSINEIIGFGIVNRVFDITSGQNNFIIRINEDLGKKIEFEKEGWCLAEVKKLAISQKLMIKRI